MREIVQKLALFTQHGIGTRLISEQVVPHLSDIDAGVSWLSIRAKWSHKANMSYGETFTFYSSS